MGKGINIMQINRMQNNNTNFGATLRINSRYRKMDQPVIDFLETQFSKRTAKISGQMEVELNGDTGCKIIKDKLSYKNCKGYKETINLDFNSKQPKEALLDRLVIALNGFLVRERAIKRIDELKNELIEISDQAYRDSEELFKKSFEVCENSLSTGEIAKKNSSMFMMVHRF